MNSKIDPGNALYDPELKPKEESIDVPLEQTENQLEFEFSRVKTEHLTRQDLPLIDSTDTNGPCYYLEISTRETKRQNADCEPVAVIILEKAAFHERNFVCDVCFDIFTSLELLLNHKPTHNVAEFHNKRLEHIEKDNRVMIHTNVKRFKCEICDYRCAKLWNLKTHKMTHAGGNPLKCDLCDYKAARLSDYNSHKMNHGGEKSFKCDQCNYITVRLCDLNKHKRIHSGHRPYSCGFCELKFARSSHLKIHQTIHTGEKPFKCEQCGYQSARSSDLKRHQMLHTIQENQPC